MKQSWSSDNRRAHWERYGSWRYSEENARRSPQRALPSGNANTENNKTPGSPRRPQMAPASNEPFETKPTFTTAGDGWWWIYRSSFDNNNAKSNIIKRLKRVADLFVHPGSLHYANNHEECTETMAEPRFMPSNIFSKMIEPDYLFIYFFCLGFCFWNKKNWLQHDVNVQDNNWNARCELMALLDN